MLTSNHELMIPLIDGFEFDVLTQARKWYKFNSGICAEVKKRYRARKRKTDRKETVELLNEYFFEKNDAD